MLYTTYRYINILPIENISNYNTHNNKNIIFIVICFLLEPNKYVPEMFHSEFFHMKYTQIHKIGFIQIFSVCNLCRYTKYLLSPINLALFVVNFISNVILVTLLIGFYVDHLTPRSMFPCAWLFV